MGLFGALRSGARKRVTRRKIAAYESKLRLQEPGERPPPLHVEITFDAFVNDFGGEKISDRLRAKANMPLNADYIFPAHNVIAELKTLEGIFSGPSAMHSLQQVFVDCGETPASLLDVLTNRAGMPERVRTMIRKRLRRGLEDRVSRARRQLRFSKNMFGNADTKSLILFAMDSEPLFGHRTMLSHLANLMGTNYSDEHIDGVVYLNPNTPTRVTRDGMEYAGWYPFYRDNEVNDALSDFVNLLGSRWLTYCGSAIGVNNPILKLEFVEGISVVLGEPD